MLKTELIVLALVIVALLTAPSIYRIRHKARRRARRAEEDALCRLNDAARLSRKLRVDQ
jgi:hypothetical protein